jgi:hypothetical protein
MKIEARGRQEDGPFVAGGTAGKNKTLCRPNNSAAAQQRKSGSIAEFAGKKEDNG